MPYKSKPGRTTSYHTRESRSSAALLHAWRTTGAPWRRSTTTLACSKRSRCVSRSALSGTSADAKCVKIASSRRCGLASTSGSVRSRLSCRKPSRFMPVSILRWYPIVAPRAAAAACTARAADGLEMVGVSECSKRPARSLTLSAPKTSTGTCTPARRSTTPSSMSAHASIVAPAASRASATRSAPCPYALALTTAMMPGAVRPGSACRKA